MKHLRMIGAPLLALSLAALPANAQQLSFEARGGLVFPTGDFGDEADGGAGFAADVFYNLNPAVSLFRGFPYEMFDCADCGGDGYTSNGLEAGAKFMFARESGLLPWAKVGAIFNKLNFDEGSVDVDSDRSLGLQAAVGLDIPLGETLSFSPALRYQAWTADLGTLLGGDQDVRTFSLDFGIHVHPGG